MSSCSRLHAVSVSTGPAMMILMTALPSLPTPFVLASNASFASLKV